MARSRAAPSASRSSSASHHSAPPPAPAHPTPSSHNTQQQQHSSTPQQPQQPQVTNVYIQRAAPPAAPMMGGGGGGMGFLGTMASVATGSVIGHGISNMLFSKDSPPTEPAQAQAVAQQYGEGACGSQIKSYAKCMEVNGQNAQACNWAWDMFMQCQDQKGGMAPLDLQELQKA
eukprot:CAMPEP_0176439996 /NCGR_PEP_ID=MMETSP0127-20121128/20296_1 /TAXON_ID=938130 /ORGANISM="Platyophrya macrostoma, Strain WH" /LENGTH=173 /DNA_ID=CAMNT_0017824413 /DNA_START=50 /DNA_END=568 /DNA_ORIENTATION=-